MAIEPGSHNVMTSYAKKWTGISPHGGIMHLTWKNHKKEMAATCLCLHEVGNQRPVKMITGKKRWRNGPLCIGGTYLSKPWDDKVANTKVSKRTRMAMWLRVGKRGDLNKHWWARTVRLPNLLSTQTWQKLTKATYVVCDQTNSSNERDREGSRRKVIQKRELSYQRKRMNENVRKTQ